MFSNKGKLFLTEIKLVAVVNLRKVLGLFTNEIFTFVCTVFPCNAFNQAACVPKEFGL